MTGRTNPFKLLKLVAAGVAATALGIWLLVEPDMGLPGGERRAADYMPGIGATVAGLVILGFAAWVVFRRPGGK